MVTDRRYQYKGRLNKVKDGRPCVRWATHPDGRKWPDTFFPDHSVSDAQNYCRNPDSSDGPPWCYVDNSQTSQQQCDIPECGKYSYI